MKPTYEELEQRIIELENRASVPEIAFEERLRMLTDHLPDTVLYQVAIGPDDSRRFVYISNNITEIAGVSPESVLADANVMYGRTVPEFIPVLMEDEKKALRTMTTFRSEFQWRRPDGELLWFAVASTPRRLHDGTVIWDGAQIDITERKQNEMLRLRSEKRFREMVDNAAAGIYQMTTDGKFRMVNPKFAAIFGFDSPQEFQTSVANVDQLLVSPEKRISIIQELNARGHIENAEIQYKRRDGKLIWCSINARTVENENGETLYEGFLVDVTEQKETREKLRASREMFQLVMDTIPQFIFWKNRDCIYQGCNRNFARVAGVENPEGIVGKSDYDLAWSQKEAAFFVECDKRVMESDTPEYRIVEPQLQSNGKQAWLETNKVPLHDINGEVIGVLGTYEDITDRKENQEQISQQERIFRLFVHNTPAAVAMFDREMRYLAYSKRWIRDFSLEDTDITGKCHYDLFANISKNWKQQHERCFGGEVILNDEEKFTREDGSVDWLRRELHPWRNSAGDIGGLILFAEVITDRKKAEDELIRLHNLLANITDSMPSALVTVDTQGQVTQWNSEACKVTGVTAMEAIGKYFPDVYPTLNIEIEKIKTVVTEKQAHKYSRVKTQLNEEVRLSDVTIYPLITNGIEGAVIRVDDITDRVRIEEMMIQSEKMLSVGGLAAGMAHEINNPLAGIMQNIQVIRNRLEGSSDKDNRAAEESGASMAAVHRFLTKRGIFRMLESVVESSTRATQIVDNMLSFSRKSDGGGSTYDVAELLEKTLALAETDYDLKKKYDFRKIKIIREYERDLPPVNCQGSKIQQVLLNILKNGTEAMHDHDTVEVPQFQLRIYRKNDTVRVGITDNGPGMSEDVRRRVFEPFFTTKPVNVGTGLGLSVSYFIVTENHKGTMTVDSSPGKGATFTIGLPLNIEE